MSEHPTEKDIAEEHEDRDFVGYAYAITGIIVGLLLVGPELISVFAEVIMSIVLSSILGANTDINLGIAANIDEALPVLILQLEYGNIVWSFSELRYLSPMLFLLTTTIKMTMKLIVFLILFIMPFPLSWLVICAIECIHSIYKAERSLDTVFDISYNALSVVLISAGVFLNFWITSWAAFPVALIICWALNKSGMVETGKYSNLS